MATDFPHKSTSQDTLPACHLRAEILLKRKWDGKVLLVESSGCPNWQLPAVRLVKRESFREALERWHENQLVC